MKLFWTALFLTLAPLAQAETASPLVVLPQAIELGEQQPDSTHTRSVWIVNDSDQALELRGAKGGCGCVQVPGFVPSTVAAHGALELKVQVRAPKQDGKLKQTRLALHTSRGDTLIPVEVSANAEAPVAAKPKAELVAALPTVRQISPDLVLELQLGAQVEKSLWLVNTGPTAMGIEEVRTSCGCVKAAQLPETIAAGQAVRIPLTVKASKAPKHEGRRWLDVRLDSSEVLRLPLVVTTLAPEVAGV